VIYDNNSKPFTFGLIGSLIFTAIAIYLVNSHCQSNKELENVIDELTHYTATLAEKIEELTDATTKLSSEVDDLSFEIQWRSL